MVSSVPLNSLMTCSSSLWRSWVPQMKRTEAIPKPRSSRAFLAVDDDLGVVGQAEVVVGAEVDDLTLGNVDRGALRRRDHPFLL